MNAPYVPYTPCPTCDRPRPLHKPCRSCAALARFDALEPIDCRGEGSIGYSSLSHLYDKFDPPRAPLEEPRFLCLRAWETLATGTVDAYGVPLVGRDRMGAWFGTEAAPCIVRGSADTAIVHLIGRLGGKAWSGHYFGDRREALLAMPEDVQLEFIELLPVPQPQP